MSARPNESRSIEEGPQLSKIVVNPTESLYVLLKGENYSKLQSLVLHNEIDDNCKNELKLFSKKKKRTQISSRELQQISKTYSRPNMSKNRLKYLHVN